jgi:hypothetical protein
LTSLTVAVADPPEAWADLGFAVDAGVCRVGEVAFVLGAGGKGLPGWSLAGSDGAGIDGLPAVDQAPGAGMQLDTHANGTVDLDHLVVTTPDHERTLGAFQAAGYDLRRVRETDSYGSPMRQGFFKHGAVVLEVIGPAQPAGDGPARLWGLAFTVADLDATAVFLGDRLHPPKDAVQEGRRIATVDKSAGSTVPIAFMSGMPARG